MNPEHLKYTKEHEWVLIENNTAQIGITNHAAEELGEVVFCELPEVDDELTQGDEFGSVESVKTVSSLYSPISGTVIEINEELNDNPASINEAPYTDGWMIKLEISDEKELADLLTADEYQTFIDDSE
jgi:glycine cleavage system H protein